MKPGRKKKQSYMSNLILNGRDSNTYIINDEVHSL